MQKDSAVTLFTKVKVKYKPKLHTKIKADAQVIADELVEWILMNRSFGISDISRKFIIKVFNGDESLNLTNISTLQNWCSDFEKKHAYFPFKYSYRREASIPYP